MAGELIAISGMSTDVRGVFELVRMHPVFDIFPTAGDAVQAFPQAAATGVNPS